MTGRAWTPAEDVFLRENYLARGCAWCAEQLRRPFRGTCKRAAKLGLRRHRPWTYRDDDHLRISWGPHPIRAIAKTLGRTEQAVYQRAKELGLGLGVPQGFETLTHAAERTGFATSQLRVILRAGGVRITRGLTRPSHRVVRPHHVTHIVEPHDVDEAVAAWLATETIQAGARRHGYEGSVLRRLALEAIAKGDARIPAPPTRARYRWRIPSAVIDELFAARSGLETVEQAADRHGLHRRTLLGYLAWGGLTFRRGMKLDPREVDRILASRAEHETIGEAARRHGRSWPFVREVVLHALATGQLKARHVDGRHWLLPRTTFDRLIASHLAGESGRRCATTASLADTDAARSRAA
jgi:hypothetical protein